MWALAKHDMKENEMQKGKWFKKHICFKLESIFDSTSSDDYFIPKYLPVCVVAI